MRFFHLAALTFLSVLPPKALHIAELFHAGIMQNTELLEAGFILQSTKQKLLAKL